MLPWEERRARYEERGEVDEQKSDDKIGRRILRGMGLTEKALYRVEGTLFGTTFPEAPTVVRALQVFNEQLGRCATNSEFSGRADTACIESHAAAVAHMEDFCTGDANTHIHGLLFAISKDATRTQQGYAYVAYGKNVTLGELLVGGLVMDWSGDVPYRIIAYKLKDFVAEVTKHVPFGQ